MSPRTVVERKLSTTPRPCSVSRHSIGPNTMSSGCGPPTPAHHLRDHVMTLPRPCPVPENRPVRGLSRSLADGDKLRQVDLSARGGPAWAPQRALRPGAVRADLGRAGVWLTVGQVAPRSESRTDLFQVLPVDQERPGQSWRLEAFVDVTVRQRDQLHRATVFSRSGRAIRSDFIAHTSSNSPTASCGEDVRSVITLRNADSPHLVHRSRDGGLDPVLTRNTHRTLSDLQVCLSHIHPGRSDRF